MCSALTLGSVEKMVSGMARWEVGMPMGFCAMK
jgi:hypothetical protein